MRIYLTTYGKILRNGREKKNIRVGSEQRVHDDTGSGLLFRQNEQKTKRKEIFPFLSDITHRVQLAFPSPFSTRRESCTGRGCQRLSVCRGIKFLSEKFFALENTVNSPSTFLAVDADKLRGVRV